MRQKPISRTVKIGCSIGLSLFTIRQGWLQVSQSSEFQKDNHIRIFCGEWMRYVPGTIPQPPWDILSLSDGIPKCQETKDSVGYTFFPNASKLYCNPKLQEAGRLPAVVALNLQRRPMNGTHPTRPEYAIVSPSHNVAEILNITARQICSMTVGLWEIVFVLDFPYDSSLTVLRDIVLSDTCQQNKGLLRARVVIQPSPVFETSSDNIGFFLLEDVPSHFFLELQSDMMIEGYGWNYDLARPILERNNIFSVSGRCGHSLLKRRGYQVGRCSRNFRKLDNKLEKDTYNSFYVTDTNNRGPIIYRADMLRSLKFYNEVEFFLGDDDHELNKRARTQNWSVAYKYAKVYSPIRFSPMRNKEFKAILNDKAKLEEESVLEYRRRRHNHSICGPDSVSYSGMQFALKHNLNNFSTDFDFHQPLPPLSTLLTY
jgi:hypothetical protein